ncbi:MAG: ribbon-helix-helix protein, CopG family [Planctomycetes bacterium]|nr:ribbon-helix-helix protein, CopG family [Planctomycetota bacterium]
MAIKLDKRRPPLRRRDPAKGPEVRLTIRLGVELVERIVAEATRRNVSRSESFRLAVSKGLDALARAREELDRTGA